MHFVHAAAYCHTRDGTQPCQFGELTPLSCMIKCERIPSIFESSIHGIYIYIYIYQYSARAYTNVIHIETTAFRLRMEFSNIDGIRSHFIMQLSGVNSPN